MPGDLFRRSPAQVAGADVPSFVAHWRGKFRAARRDDPRYEALARKGPAKILLDTDILIDIAFDGQTPAKELNVYEETAPDNNSQTRTRTTSCSSS